MDEHKWRPSKTLWCRISYITLFSHGRVLVANHNSEFLLVLVSSLLDLRGGLAGDTGGAAERGHGVLRGGAPDVVPDYI